MARMFLQSDNGGYGVLIGDGEKWYYWSDYNLPVELDADTYEENAEIIRNAINSGDMYNADDFITDAADVDERYISAYDGMTIEQIDEYENKDRDFDFTTYVEI